MRNAECGLRNALEARIPHLKVGDRRVEQVLILVAAIGSMFALIALVIWLAWLSARRDSEDSA
jgi:hypothetical protein